MLHVPLRVKCPCVVCITASFMSSLHISEGLNERDRRLPVLIIGSQYANEDLCHLCTTFLFQSATLPSCPVSAALRTYTELLVTSRENIVVLSLGVGRGANNSSAEKKKSSFMKCHTRPRNWAFVNTVMNNRFP